MKFEIIKYTTQFSGQVWYKIHTDGRYLSGSVSQDLEKVRETLELAKKFILPEKETEEVIETIEI